MKKNCKLNNIRSLFVGSAPSLRGRAGGEAVLSFLLLLSTLLFQSCLKDQEDIFDKSSSLRMQEVLDKTKATLTSNENGWALDYYPDRNLTYGGIAYAIQFKGTEATVYSQEYEKSETSLYKLTNDDGPVLSFDSYNSVMHAYATPSSDEYEAQDGDFEFIIMDVQDDLITLKGKRNGNTMYMHRLNKPAEDYINDVLDIKEKMRSSKYAFVIDNDTIIVKRNLNVFTFTNPKDAKNIDIPFVTTATGFEFYDRVDIMGKNVTGFTYSEDGIWANPADKSVALVSLPLTLPEILMTNTWSIVASGMSETALKYFNVAKEGSAAEGETINYMILGPNDITGLGSINGYSGAFGFTFTSGNYKGSLLIDAEELTDDIITFNFAYIGEGNGVWYYNNAKYNWIISALCGAKGATYTLTADDPKNPTYIKMQQIENPEIYFTVYNGLIAEPFDK
jgi:hypothetical protein